MVPLPIVMSPLSVAPRHTTASAATMIPGIAAGFFRGELLSHNECSTVVRASSWPEAISNAAEHANIWPLLGDASPS